ncbi:O-antigen polymerase [Cedecea neteri]|nr:O-antigen polymerase [Cedecea neteri]
MISIIYFILALILYGFAYLKSKDLLNPLGIGILLWYLACSLANFDLLFDYKLQEELSLQTNVCMLLSGLCFVLPICFSYRKNALSLIGYQKIHYGKAYNFFFNLIVIASIIAFLYRFQHLIFAPALFSGASNDLKSTVPDALPGVNYIDLFTPYAAILALIEIKYSLNLSKKRFVILFCYILFSIISSLVYKVSRGEFLIFGLAYLYIYLATKRNKINFKKMLFILVFVLLFFAVGAMRLSDESRVSTQFGSGVLNSILSQIYTYIAINFQNLNALINSNSELTYVWGGLKFLLKPFFTYEYDTNQVGLSDYSVGFFNAKTFIYYFYNDLSYVGIIIYPLIIGIVVQLIYNSMCRDVKYLTLTASLMKAVVFMFFGNYFFGELVLIFPYLLIFFFLTMMKTINIRVDK